jgi:hypothetical protein
VVTFSNVGISGLVGSYDLNFTSVPVLTPVTQTAIALTPGVASKLVITTPAAGAVNGVAFTTQPVVAVQDAQGNTRSSDNSTVVTMTVSGSATRVGTFTATATNGVATFTTVGISGNTSTAYDLTFASGVLASATQVGITPLLGAATHLTLTTFAAGAVNGAAFGTPPVVEVRDAGNNVELGDNSTVVTMTVSAGATVVGTATKTAVNGVADFTTTGVGITGTVGAAYTLAFASALLTSATQSITAGLGAATHLVLTTAAAGAASGAAFTTQPVVEVQDAGNNRVTTDNATQVTMAAAGASAVGTATVTVSGGVATFTNVGISGLVGTYDLNFTSSPVLTTATQPAIGLAAGVGTQFTIETEPSAAATSGVPFAQQPVLQLRDGAGNPVAQAGVDLLAEIATGTGSLSGTVALQTNPSGVATYTDLAITGSGAHTLKFTDLALTTPVVTSTAITLP